MTGSHRSGTTWVGRVLSAGAGLGYVHEPFNVSYVGTWLRHRPPHWYQFVDEQDAQPYTDDLAALLRCRYPLATRLREVQHPHDVLTIGKQQALALQYRIQRRRLLLKDPLALLATPWLERRFGMRPVVLVRHPAGFVSSLARLGWRFDFRQFTGQTRLMDQLPAATQAGVSAAAGDELPPIEQAALLWNVLYGIVAEWPEGEHRLLVRHEDLATDPGPAFRRLFDQLGLRFGTPAEDAVRATDVGAAGELPIERRHDSHRNAAAAASSWHQRLDGDEVKAIRASTEALAARWYPSSSWEPLSP